MSLSCKKSSLKMAGPLVGIGEGMEVSVGGGSVAVGGNSVAVGGGGGKGEFVGTIIGLAAALV